MKLRFISKRSYFFIFILTGYASISCRTEQYFVVPESDFKPTQYYNSPQTTDLLALKDPKPIHENLTASTYLEDQQTLVVRKQVVDVDKNKGVVTSAPQQKNIETTLPTTIKSNEPVIQDIIPAHIIPVPENKTPTEVSLRSALPLPITGILSGSFSRLKKVVPKDVSKNNNNVLPKKSNSPPSHVDLKPQKTIINPKEEPTSKMVEHKREQPNTPKLIVDADKVIVSNVPQLVGDQGIEKKETAAHEKSVKPNTPSVVIEKEMKKTDIKEPTPVILSTDSLTDEEKIKKWFEVKPEFFLTYLDDAKKKEDDSNHLRQTFTPQITINKKEKVQNIEDSQLQKGYVDPAAMPQFILNTQ